jgi:ABC-type polysaccharide/polyol phosphate transport system ATPase subunit
MSLLLDLNNVNVRYRTNHAGIHSMKDLLTSFANPFQTTLILKDISFQLQKGQSMGILGRNGSGKSTLLRAIAGIIKPSKGSLKSFGTIAPILALGAGLELELTGYENIQLLLSLYGRKATKEAINEIASFSELDDATLNQATKCYSSGMLARLTFSISFSHHCDIYIIDEVLAVGDMGFQTKCIDKINELKKQGKSIIFVSHFPDEVVKICDQAILLEKGVLIHKGTSEEVCQHYKELF